MRDLGTLPGGSSSTATDINDLGQVIGDATTADGDTHPFLWSP
jgi:probable HAF family extracellular repeat protein